MATTKKKTTKTEAPADGKSVGMDLCNWNNDTMLQLAEEFIQKEKLWDDYEAFLEKRANEELAECGGSDN
jgi:hypothetical protein